MRTSSRHIFPGKYFVDTVSIWCAIIGTMISRLFGLSKKKLRFSAVVGLILFPFWTCSIATESWIFPYKYPMSGIIYLLITAFTLLIYIPYICLSLVIFAKSRWKDGRRWEASALVLLCVIIAYVLTSTIIEHVTGLNVCFFYDRPMIASPS
jgi:hypothetical protein